MAINVPSPSSGADHELSDIISLDSDHDSAVGGVSNRYSLTTSLTPSVCAFHSEHGRRYHSYDLVQYLLPNDEQEQTRLNFQHALWLRILNDRLYCAPLHRSTQDVLDIGTGTGIWAMDMGKDPIFEKDNPTEIPSSGQLPICARNWRRHQSYTAPLGWTFTQSFDYIHGRGLVYCFQDFPGVILKAFDALKPGGYLEFQEISLPFWYDKHSLPGVELDKWVELVFKGSESLGQDWRKPDKCKELMEGAGFVGIYTETYPCPINQWGTGKQLADIISNGLLAISMQVFMRGLGWTYEEVVGFLEGVKRDLQDPNVHVYANFEVVYGQKP